MFWGNVLIPRGKYDPPDPTIHALTDGEFAKLVEDIANADGQFAIAMYEGKPIVIPDSIFANAEVQNEE